MMLRLVSNIISSRPSTLITRNVPSARYFCVVQSTNGEAVMLGILKDKFPKAEYVEVRDISGGCGAMYEIYVETPDFVGLNTVKQHRLVTEALKDQIKEMHGLRIHTKIPGPSE